MRRGQPAFIGPPPRNHRYEVLSVSMVHIAPFHGVFYSQKKVRDLAKAIAPPYDVITKEEQEKLYKRSPYNFVRLDLSQEPDSYPAAAHLLNEWHATGVFERDATPS